MRAEYELTVVLLVAVMFPLLGMFAGIVSASPAAKQYQFRVQLDGISAVQLAWWFQHIADKNGIYWKQLAPEANKRIRWVVTPTDDAHQIIGSLYEFDQMISGGLFTSDNLRMQIQFEDYITQPRQAPGAPAPFMPTLPFPSDYAAPHPSPLGMATYANNGFNQDMLLLDGHGFVPGRILWSWKNTGCDDTAATAGKPYSIDLYCTFYLPWMEGANRPPALSADGYYFTEAQVNAIWGLWQQMLKSLPTQLPGWFGTDTQDDIARSKGWTVSSVIDTGVVAGANSEMEVWWWMHGMGDEPGNAYVFWHPSVHHAIRWLPGYSPQDVVGKGKRIPTDRVVPGIIYPDLQGDNLVQDGGGMMAYPVSMSPVPGVYKFLNPMMIVTKEQVDNFAKVRFPEPSRWLLHQWEDVPGGLIHRSTVLSKLPLSSPVTQADFYSEHQLQEGLFKGLIFLPKLYENWLKAQKKK